MHCMNQHPGNTGKTAGVGGRRTNSQSGRMVGGVVGAEEGDEGLFGPTDFGEQ